MAEIARKPQTCRECNVSPQARASQARAGRAVAGCRVGGEVTGLTPGVGCAGRRDVNPVSIKPLPRGHTGGQAGFPWVSMPLGTAPVTSGHEFRKAIPVWGTAVPACSDLCLGVSHVPGGVGTEDTGWPARLRPSGSCLRGAGRGGASPPSDGDDQEGGSELSTAPLTCSSETVVKTSDYQDT